MLTPAAIASAVASAASSMPRRSGMRGDVVALLLELGEEGRLMLVALAADESGHRVRVGRRRLHLAALDGHVERRQVPAGEVVRKVGGRAGTCPSRSRTTQVSRAEFEALTRSPF